ncbi:hypothetical protein J2TS4_43880 [Paenibacillus sp. J2TS4]|nr:hypothetical protein J2TS4_43880 [Paenibacillus sp. J2TS4]
MRRIYYVGLFCLLTLLVTACAPQYDSVTAGGSNVLPNHPQTMPDNPNATVDYSNIELRTIYLAGGCFWGVEAYMSRIYGVSDVTSGYANGSGEDPTYAEVIKGDRGFAETVEVKYDPERISLEELLTAFFKVIDPTSLNKQGNDRGVQYRTGIYYVEEEDLPAITSAVEREQDKYDKPVVTEVLPLTNYYLAEEYHQNYLEKNPNGYCHIDLSLLDDP